MRITLLTTDFVPLVGGIADYLAGLLSSSRGKIDWSVYSTVPASGFGDGAFPYRITRLSETRRKGQRVGDGFLLIRRFNTLRWYLNLPWEAKALLRRVQSECRPDAVAIGGWCKLSHFWCQACRQLRIPYLLFAYGLELVEPVSLRLARARREDFRVARRVVSISRATKVRLLALGVQEERVVLVPPGIDPDRLQPMPETQSQALLSSSGLAHSPFVLAMGRLVRRKGFDMAVRAFGAIAPELPDISLVIAGSGPARFEVERAVADLGLGRRIRVLGEVTDVQKRALLQNCLFFVMPNRPIPGDMEGFGIVFLEAGMYGKAVIGGNNGGVPDAIIEGVTGFLVDTSGSIEPLCAAMRRLLCDPEAAERMGAAGRERALREFTWGRLAERFLDAVPPRNT